MVAHYQSEAMLIDERVLLSIVPNQNNLTMKRHHPSSLRVQLMSWQIYMGREFVSATRTSRIFRWPPLQASILLLSFFVDINNSISISTFHVSPTTMIASSIASVLTTGVYNSLLHRVVQEDQDTSPFRKRKRTSSPGAASRNVVARQLVMSRNVRHAMDVWLKFGVHDGLGHVALVGVESELLQLPLRPIGRTLQLYRGMHWDVETLEKYPHMKEQLASATVGNKFSLECASVSSWTHSLDVAKLYARKQTISVILSLQLTPDQVGELVLVDFRHIDIDSDDEVVLRAATFTKNCTLHKMWVLGKHNYAAFDEGVVDEDCEPAEELLVSIQSFPPNNKSFLEEIKVRRVAFDAHVQCMQEKFEREYASDPEEEEEEADEEEEEEIGTATEIPNAADMSVSRIGQ